MAKATDTFARQFMPDAERFAVLTGVRHPARRDPLSSAVRAMRTSLFA